MGWGTMIKPEIYLSRKIFETVGMLEDEIKDDEKYLSNIKQKLAILVASDVSKLIPSEWEEEPQSWVNNQINDLFDEIEETTIRLYKYNLLLEDFENRITD